MIGGRIGKSPCRKYLVSFRHSPTPLSEPTSKIGGSPLWLGKPSWPADVGDDTKGMFFWAQIRLDADIFPHRKSEFAYVFLGDGDNGHGSHSVVFQSLQETFATSQRFLSHEFQGPALLSFDNQSVEEFTMNHGAAVMDEPREYDDVDEDDYWAAYWKSMSEVQIGGLPFLSFSMAERAAKLIGDMDKWRLLFFAYCDCEFPLIMPTEAPIYYVFVNHDCTQGRVVDFCMLA